MNKTKESFNIIDFILNNKEIDIIMDKNNNPWFYGNQISHILGYGKGRLAINTYVNKKYTKTYQELLKSVNKRIKLFIFAHNATKFINIMGVCQLIMKSKLPIADKFQEWIYDIVLSSIEGHKINKLNKQIKIISALNEDLSLQLNNEIKLNKDLYTLLQKEIELNNNLLL